MRNILALLVAGLVAPSMLPAGEATLGDALAPAVRQVAAMAQRQQYRALLLAVRPSGNATIRAETLQVLAGQLRRQLERSNVALVDSREAAALLGARNDRGLVPPGQVAALQRLTEFDALLTADLAVGERNASIRLALVDPRRRSFMRVLNLDANLLTQVPTGLGTARPTAPVQNTPVPTDAADLAVAATNAFGTAPPLSDGPSAYRNVGGEVASLRGPRRDLGRRGGQRRDPHQPRGRQTGGTGAENCPDPMPENADGAGGDTGDESADPAEVTELNQRIVAFAVEHLGEQVGNGECWTLAADALRAAGAEPPDMYDFGEEIPLDQITPGDILQFTSARFEIPGGYILMGMPDHTAIVYVVDGQRVFVLQQNFGGPIVSILDIDFADMTEGAVQAFRAVPARNPKLPPPIDDPTQAPERDPLEGADPLAPPNGKS